MKPATAHSLNETRLGLVLGGPVPAVDVPPTRRVIESKLMLPRVHPDALRRGRLLEMIDHLHGAALTVLAAGVGYGKTTLLVQALRSLNPAGRRMLAAGWPDQRSIAGGLIEPVEPMFVTKLFEGVE